MQKEVPLAERVYFDPCYTAIVRAIGYEGCLGRDLGQKLKPMIEQFGERQVESATWRLLYADGQVVPGKPPPLARVRLKAEARKAAWGLLGPPPEHPWHAAFKSGESIPLPWEAEEKKVAQKPKRKRQKKPR